MMNYLVMILLDTLFFIGFYRKHICVHLFYDSKIIIIKNILIFL